MKRSDQLLMWVKLGFVLVDNYRHSHQKKRRSYILHKKKGWIYLCLITPEVGFMRSVDENNKYSLDWIAEAAYSCQWKLTALFAMLVIQAVFPTFIKAAEKASHTRAGFIFALGSFLLFKRGSDLKVLYICYCHCHASGMERLEETNTWLCAEPTVLLHQTCTPTRQPPSAREDLSILLSFSRISLPTSNHI